MTNSVTLTFKSSLDELPKHNEHIVYLKQSHDYENILFDTVEYQWVEYITDEDGDYPSGTTACYNEGDIPEEGWKLEVIVGGYVLDNYYTIIWMTEDEWFESLPKP